MMTRRGRREGMQGPTMVRVSIIISRSSMQLMVNMRGSMRPAAASSSSGR
jgi:hypothetical protein